MSKQSRKERNKALPELEAVKKFRGSQLQEALPGPVAVGMKTLHKTSVECGVPLAFVVFGRHDESTRTTEWITFAKDTFPVQQGFRRRLSSILRSAARELDKAAADEEAGRSRHTDTRHLDTNPWGNQ